MALSSLSGPRLPPARGPASHLVVLLHGYGADGEDLISLAPHWQALLPTAAFVAPNAPARVPGSPRGFQWFGLSRMDPGELETGLNAAAPLLEAFLDQELARLGLASDRLALVGFSQGTMLALHVGLRRMAAAIVGFSGLLASPPPSGQSTFPPVLLAHGDADQVIPVEAMFAAAVELGAAGALVRWHLASGLGHGIDPVGLSLAGGFLQSVFRGLLKSAGPACCKMR